ncbi:MAG: DCL family protein [archaeon]|nr:DCL family protein [archaeon]
MENLTRDAVEEGKGGAEGQQKAARRRRTREGRFTPRVERFGEAAKSGGSAFSAAVFQRALERAEKGAAREFQQRLMVKRALEQQQQQQQQQQQHQSQNSSQSQNTQNTRLGSDEDLPLSLQLRQQLRQQAFRLNPHALQAAPATLHRYHSLLGAVRDRPKTLLFETYSSYAELQAIVHELLAATEPGAFVSDEKMQDLLLEMVLQCHPRAHLKIRGHEISASSPNSSASLEDIDLSEFRIQVDFHPEFLDTPCFFLVRPDASRVDFSYHKCLTALFPLGASRFAYRTDVRSLSVKRNTLLFWCLPAHLLPPPPTPVPLPPPGRSRLAALFDPSLSNAPLLHDGDDDEEGNEADFECSEPIQQQRQPQQQLEHQYQHQSSSSSSSRLLPIHGYEEPSKWPSIDDPKPTSATQDRRYHWQCEAKVREYFSNSCPPVHIDFDTSFTTGIARFLSERDALRALQASEQGVVPMRCEMLDTREQDEWWERRQVEIFEASCLERRMGLFRRLIRAGDQTILN